ncbi:MAG: hypothetical protein A4E71_02645 [Smithella sp. PtaU1.Bin162]|nr:MAG: hypothetical protein A4E71_02645 [Smithella sp. PtaU1.Bin162]
MTCIKDSPAETSCGRVTAGNVFAKKKKYICIIAFFLAYLVIGVSLYKDYGVSWDEPTHRQIAMVSAKYLAGVFMPGFRNAELAALPDLADYSARQYGVVFDLPMYVAEKLLGYEGNMPEAYYLRHLCNFLLFYISVIFFFLIVKNRFKSRIAGLAACLFLILSPRIFADSFYGKDVVFLSLLIIAIYFLINFLQKKTIGSAVLFALTTALTIDQRITGAFIPFIALLMSALDILKSDKPFHKLPEKLFPVFIYIVFCLVFIFIFWPYLWSDPLGNLINSFTVMNRFPITYDVLYLGSFIKSTEVPWHYIPVWIMITTPLIYILFFLIGFVGIVQAIIRNGPGLYSNDEEKQDVLFLLLFFAPLVAVIVFNSALYDGWRHMYFLYAPFLLVAMTGLNKLIEIMKRGISLRDKVAAVFLIAVIAGSVLSTAYQMMKHHPWQNVYFNMLAGKNAGEKFELDYWGLSFRKGLEYIAANDKRPLIKLSANVSAPLINNAIFLDRRDIKRLRLTGVDQADYFLTNYRWHPQEYFLHQEVFTVRVDNQKILSVFKLR